jgi:hypothetical protein
MLLNARYRTWIFAMLVACAVFCLVMTPASAYSGGDWSRQLGTGVDDGALAISADGLGNVYISGFTRGSLGGPNAGSGDAFVSKYDAAGSLLWTQQLGTAENDVSFAVSADVLGNVYISGVTEGDLGGPNVGTVDAFVSKYDANGDLKWTRQLGNTFDDLSWGVSADDAGNVYIVGQAFGGLFEPQEAGSDTFVSKFDAAGNLLWTREPRTSYRDILYGVSADHHGNVYATGDTAGVFGHSTRSGELDAFLIKLDEHGNSHWIRQFGTAGVDQSFGVAADDFGNVYVAGGTNGDLGGTSAGGYDAFVQGYDAAGNLRWTTQFGTSGFEQCNAIATDGLGNIYVSGFTEGELGGGLNAGPYDAFVSKIDARGNLVWTRMFGSNADDRSHGISTDDQGNIYLAGITLGDLFSANQGDNDVFVVKIGDAIPEPASWLQAVCATAAIIWAHRFCGSVKSSRMDELQQIPVGGN